MLGPLSWVLIYVTDVAKTRHFYETVLGLPVKRSSHLKTIFETGNCTLELMSQLDNGPQAAQMDDKRGWDRNKTLISFFVDDIEAEVAALESRGAHCISGIRPTVSDPGVPPRGRLAQFMDPEGNIIEICQVPLD